MTSSCQCTYNGMQYASISEAKWRVVFDSFPGLMVSYEPNTFTLGDVRYRPDFLVHHECDDLSFYFEVKGSEEDAHSDEVVRKASLLSEARRIPVVVAYGDVSPTGYYLDLYVDGEVSPKCKFAHCLWCTPPCLRIVEHRWLNSASTYAENLKCSVCGGALEACREQPQSSVKVPNVLGKAFARSRKLSRQIGVHDTRSYTDAFGL